MPAVGVQIAFDDDPLEPNPTWTDIGTLDGVLVEGWSVDRGRLTELDQTGTGTARIELTDTQGVLDPTNTGGTLYGRINPRKQASIYLYNPVEPTLHSGTVFRGFVEDWTVTMDLSMLHSKVTIDLVDAFANFAVSEIQPGKNGDAYTNSGDVIYAGGTSTKPFDRITTVMDEFGWPPALQQIFTGNVSLQAGTYAPNTQALAVMQDTADAEFPGVANLYVNRQGTVTFHGRMARFRPEVADYGIAQWTVGDMTAFFGDSDTAVISALSYNLGESSIINSALATPQNIAGTSVAGNLSQGTTSISTFGTHAWAAEGLYTGGGVASNVGDPVAETKLFSDYYRDNKGQPTSRISQIQMTSPHPRDATAQPVWRVICQADISDIFNVYTTHPGGGGFIGEGYFIEGIHYNASALGTSHHHIEFTADVSPQADYAVPTFGTTATI